MMKAGGACMSTFTKSATTVVGFAYAGQGQIMNLSQISGHDFATFPHHDSGAISAIAFTLDISFLFILSKYRNSPLLPSMRLKAHGSFFARPLMVRPLFLRRATESPPFRSTVFCSRRAACQIHKFQHYSYGWV